MAIEHAVRDAAAKLQDAIAAARAEGYRIDWPANAAGLSSIAISETAKVAAAAPAAPVDPEPTPAAPAADDNKPAAAFGRRKGNNTPPT